MEVRQMTVKPRRPRGGRPGPQRSAGDLATAKQPAGRPKGEPSTIVNVRLPLTLVAELDRYLDWLEGQTGLKANRGMITRRALALFLASHAAEDARGGEG
jgi:hypothetical protein